MPFIKIGQRMSSFFKGRHSPTDNIEYQQPQRPHLILPAMSRIVSFLPMFDQLSCKAVNKTFDVVVVSEIVDKLVTPKQSCYVLNIHALFKQLLGLITPKQLASGDKSVLDRFLSFILQILEINLDTRLADLRAFFFNILYCGIKDITQHARLQHILAKMCMQNTLSIERFGWLYYAHGDAGEVECMSDTHGGCMQNYDAVLIWISHMPNLRVLHVGYLHGISRMVEWDTDDYRLRRGNNAARRSMEQQIFSMWDPLLFNRECRKENPSSTAVLPNLREIHFLDELDKVVKYFVAVAEARMMSKTTTYEITTTTLKQVQLVTYAEQRSSSFDDRNNFSAKSFSRIFPRACSMARMKQLILSGSNFSSLSLTEWACQEEILAMCRVHHDTCKKSSSLRDCSPPDMLSVLRMPHNQRILILFSQLASAAADIKDRSKEFSVDLEINLSGMALLYQGRDDECCWQNIPDLLLNQQFGGPSVLSLKISVCKISYGRGRNNPTSPKRLLKPPIASSVLKLWNAASSEFHTKSSRVLALKSIIDDSSYADAYYLDFNYYKPNSARKMLQINYRTLYNDDDDGSAMCK